MRTLVVVFLMLLLTSVSHGRGNPFLDSLLKRQATKSKSRWTLSDWLTQKKNFKAQDHWLAINTSSNIFELMLQGGIAEVERIQDNGVPTELDMNRYQAATYLTIFGIEGMVEDVKDDYEAVSQQFNIRLLGQAIQSTNLTAFYGQRAWEDKLNNFEVDNNYYGGSLAIYLLPFLGIEGKYTQFLEDTASNAAKVDGYRTEYSAFLELSLIRVFGTYVEDVQERVTAGTPSKFVRDGIYTGLSLFF